MSPHDPGSARDMAAYWATRMNESPDAVTAPERERFCEWLFASPVNEAEYYAACGTLNMMMDRPAAERTREQTWESRYRVRARSQLIGWWALAASVLVLMISGGYVAQTHGWLEQTYATRTGETRTATFKDGSVAYLNTRTTLRWSGSEDDRRVSMGDGEALFEVVHDPAHPFRVVLDNSEIQVLGTRFNVYRKPSGDTIVTVLEGVVEVRGFGGNLRKAEWVRKVSANQQIEYSRLGLMREPYTANAQNAVVWRTGELRFDDEPVPKVFDELTRYTDQRILIRDPHLSDVRISGKLSVRNVRAALEHLKFIAPIEVEEKSGSFTLSYRDGTQSSAPQNDNKD